MRFFLLYQNLLFYYDQEHHSRPTGVIFLEGCYVDRVIAPSTTANSVVLSQTLAKNLKEEKLQVSSLFYQLCIHIGLITRAFSQTARVHHHVPQGEHPAVRSEGQHQQRV